MNQFIMLMGLPGSGKSTFAKELVETYNFEVFSSDAIRQELGLSEKETDKTFSILYERLKEACSEKKNVIYDATNLSRKRRISCLNYFSHLKWNYYFYLYNFITPLDICKYRNQNRERVVPDFVYENMLKQYNIPMRTEGWSYVYNLFYPNMLSIERYHKIIADMRHFDQKNSHHSLSLFNHCYETALQANDLQLVFKEKDYDLLYTAALYHDIGKLYTQTFKDKKGNISEDAHYYSHDNYGTYIFLTEIAPFLQMTTDFTEKDLINIAILINWHMRPYYVWDKDPDSTASNKDYALLGRKLTFLLKKLHEFDRIAH